MEILWFGSSSFLIKNSTGKRLFFDPFLHNNNFEFSSLLPDIVTISHNHFDSNLLDKFRDTCTIVSSVGSYSFDFCTITGYETYHDNCSGTKRGSNIIYKVEIDGFSLLHLGDLGHLLDEPLLNQIGNIDILFIPIGGHIALTGEVASKLTKIINPSVVIPMSYRTVSGPVYLDGPQHFIKKLNVDTFSKENPFVLNKQDCDKNTKVFLIDSPLKYK